MGVLELMSRGWYLYQVKIWRCWWWNSWAHQRRLRIGVNVAIPKQPSVGHTTANGVGENSAPLQKITGILTCKGFTLPSTTIRAIKTATSELNSSSHTASRRCTINVVTEGGTSQGGLFTPQTKHNYAGHSHSTHSTLTVAVDYDRPTIYTW